MKKLMFLIIAIVAFATSSFAYNVGYAIAGPYPGSYHATYPTTHGLWALLESSAYIYIPGSSISACSTLYLKLNGNVIWYHDCISYPVSSNKYSTSNLPYFDTAEFYLTAQYPGTGASYWAMIF